MSNNKNNNSDSESGQSQQQQKKPLKIPRVPRDQRVRIERGDKSEGSIKKRRKWQLNYATQLAMANNMTYEMIKGIDVMKGVGIA